MRYPARTKTGNAPRDKPGKAGFGEGVTLSKGEACPELLIVDVIGHMSQS